MIKRSRDTFLVNFVISGDTDVIVIVNVGVEVETRTC